MKITRGHLMGVQPYKASERPAPVKRPEDCTALWRDPFALLDDGRERFLAWALDARHQPVALPWVVSVGSLNASMVHPREVFGPALCLRAAAIMVAHNHPSGDPRPSGDDLDLTDRLTKCGELLGVALLDHFIIPAGAVGAPVGSLSFDQITSIREYGWPLGASGGPDVARFRR